MKCFPLMLQETGNYVSWLTVCVSALRTLKSIAGPRDWFCCNKESLQGCWRMSVPSEDNGRAQVKSLRGSLRCWDQSSWTLTHIEVWAMSTSISWGRWTVGKPNTEYAPQYFDAKPIVQHLQHGMVQSFATSSPSFICWYSQSNNSDVVTHALFDSQCGISSRMAP